MIEVTGLTKRFGRLAAVADLSFSVDEGEAVCLWGSNGAGKTTVIRCVLGLISFRGRISVAGHDVTRAGKSARRRLGYVPQELAIYDDERVVHAVNLFARLKRASRDEVATALREVGLMTHRRKRVRELSGGMKQRLALAIALLADPPILVLDELTANLDAAAQEGFMDLLRALKARGKTVLFTSHHAPEVEALADRVLMLDSGRIRETVAAADFARHVGGPHLLKVMLELDRIDAAIELLRREGFVVNRNGRGIFVEVDPSQRALPVTALCSADIPVLDIELTTGAIRQAKQRDTIDG